jgi:hypothetical protein
VAAIHGGEAPRRFPALPIVEYASNKSSSLLRANGRKRVRKFLEEGGVRGDVSAAREEADDRVTQIFLPGRRTSAISEAALRRREMEPE